DGFRRRAGRPGARRYPGLSQDRLPGRTAAAGRAV
ncbi:MAG: hypothetical protein AVDCRST_MAG90-3303, partial [uncultured Microvirga sp.]